MKMIIMGGFLGAGKTSLVLQMARYLVGDNPDHPAKVVILENEIGEVSIDDKVLQKGGFEVETMFSGCVCCTMAGELVSNVYQVMEKLNPDWIIMEATGVAYPLRIKENLEHSIRMESCQIFCVADAKRWIRLRKVMAAFMRDQLDQADVVFINKIDAVDDEMLKEVDESVKAFNGDARCFHVSAASTIDQSVWEAVFNTEQEAQ